MPFNYETVFEPVIDPSGCVRRPIYVSHVSAIATLLEQQKITESLEVLISNPDILTVRLFRERALLFLTI